MVLNIHGTDWASLVAQMAKNLPAFQKTWFWILDQEDPPGEGNGNPLQYSCLESSMDRGAWRAAVHGVTKSRTGPRWPRLIFRLQSFDKRALEVGEISVRVSLGPKPPYLKALYRLIRWRKWPELSREREEHVGSLRTHSNSRMLSFRQLRFII